MHDWTDEACVQMIKKCKEAIPAEDCRGKAIIVDMVLDPGCNDAMARENQYSLDLLNDTKEPSHFDGLYWQGEGRRRLKEDFWRCWLLWLQVYSCFGLPLRDWSLSTRIYTSSNENNWHFVIKGGEKEGESRGLCLDGQHWIKLNKLSYNGIGRRCLHSNNSSHKWWRIIIHNLNPWSLNVTQCFIWGLNLWTMISFR